MRFVFGLGLMLLWCVPVLAANRCYDTSAVEDKTIQWAASRDGVTALQAWTALIGSAIAAVREEAKSKAESPLQSSYRECLEGSGTFSISADPDTGLPIGVCQ